MNENKWAAIVQHVSINLSSSNTFFLVVVAADSIGVIRESPYQSRTANEIVSLSNDYHSRHTTKYILNIGTPNAYNASFKIPPK